jgi:plastocyanin
MSRSTWTFLLVAAAVVAGGFAVIPRRRSAATTAAAARHMPAADPAGPRVTIDNFAFDPQVVTVAPGTKVTWLNRDDVPHTATSSASPPKFNSKAIDTDGQYSFVFTQPGTYPYFCAVHPKMTATIIVK